MRLVLKIGGSILAPKFGDLKANFEAWASVIAQMLKMCDKVVVVTGGGRPAREYINATPEGVTEYDKDEIGILVTRVNAALLGLHLRARGLIVPHRIPIGPEEVRELLDKYDVVIVGGYIPGESTVGVAAITAEAVSADLLMMATNVNGIYDRPPHVKGAKKYKKVSPSELLEVFIRYPTRAGTYQMLDVVALKILQRAKVSAIIFDGTSPENALRVLKAYMAGKLEELYEFGTLVIS